MIKEAVDKLLYAVFPRRCSLCGEVTMLDEDICECCRNLERISGKLCKTCGRPTDECDCSKHEKKPEYKAFVAPYYYDDSVAAGVNRFKDYGFSELGLKMGEEIYKQIKDCYKGISFDFVTFVPITQEKLNKRGYNQSELLAREVAKHMNIPCEELILKIKSTPQQKRSSARQRKINLRGSFDLKGNIEVEDKTILVIDDIKTTGSTLNECAYVLNAYGAKAVYTAAFCTTKNKY